MLVIETALPILHRIENILLELTPRKWAAGGISDARARQLFMCLFDADFYAVTLPRRDVDYYVPGDVDMRDPPERLIVNNVDEFMHHVDWAKTAYRELWNPNYWFLRREYISGASQRVRAASVPSCAPSLAVMYDRDDAAGHYTRPGGE